MTKEDATVLVIAVNRIQPHVAPLLYEALAQCRAVSLASAVANGAVTCTVTPVDPVAPAGGADAKASGAA